MPIADFQQCGTTSRPWSRGMHGDAPRFGQAADAADIGLRHVEPAGAE